MRVSANKVSTSRGDVKGVRALAWLGLGVEEPAWGKGEGASLTAPEELQHAWFVGRTGVSGPAPEETKKNLSHPAMEMAHRR